LALLRDHPLFGKLAPAELRRLCALTAMQRLAAGAALPAGGTAGTCLYGVLAGTVEVAAPSLDRGTKRLHAGDVLGESALLDGEPRTAGAAAVTDCELAVIKRSDFQKFLQDEPRAAARLVALLSLELRETRLQLDEMTHLPTPTRLARLLLRLSEGRAARRGNSGSIKLTQREIGRMLGATRETVNKHLQVLVRRRWVKAERGGITVVAPAALAGVAEVEASAGKSAGAKASRVRRRSA
jgi:CRP/FNR family transcriptional regulator, cyclic AMP receptor protein